MNARSPAAMPATASASGPFLMRPVARSAAAALVALYAVALFVFPSDFGVRFLGFVWSPSRVTLILLVVAAVLAGYLRPARLRAEPWYSLAAWTAFVCAAATTALLYPGPGVAARFISLFVEGMVLYVVVRSVVEDRPMARRVILAAVAATTFVAVVALALSIAGLRYDALLATLSGQPLPPNVSGERFGLARQQGPFPAALFLAIWMGSSSVLVLPWTESPLRRTRMLAIATWSLLLIGVIFLTVSRVAVTGMLLIAGCYLLLRHRRAIGLVAIGAAFVVGVGFAGLSMGSPPPSLGQPGQPLATPASSGPNGSPEPGDSTDVELLAGSNELRIQALRATVRAVAQRPLFGWGLLRAKDVVTSVGGATNYVDSTPLAVVVEMGLIGLGALVAVAAAALVVGRGAHRTAEGLATYLALLSVATMSVVAAYLLITQGYASFWLLAGLLPAFQPARSLRSAARAVGDSAA